MNQSLHINLQISDSFCIPYFKVYHLLPKRSFRVSAKVKEQFVRTSSPSTKLVPQTQLRLAGLAATAFTHSLSHLTGPCISHLNITLR